MKLVQINSTVNTGSTGRIAEDIGKVALRLGYESTIAYGRGDRPSESNLLKIGDNFSVVSHGIRSLLFDRHGFGSLKATRELCDQLRKISPDVVFLHNLHGYYVHIGELFNTLRELNKPVYWTLYDCWAFTGHCTYFDDISCQKWLDECHSCPKTHKYPKSLVVDNSRTNFKDKRRLLSNMPNLNLIANSVWLNELIGKSFLSNLPRYHIPTGVDLTVFRPASEEQRRTLREKYLLGSKKVLLGVASVWDPRKGLDDLIRLASLMPSEFIVVVVGVDSRQIAKLPPNMLGVKRTENVRELAAWYSLADVFINPTYQDNFPTTNLEALACGTPVITYNTGGSPEAIDIHTGITVEKGKVEQLKEATLTIEAKAGWEENCVTRARNQFNKADRYLDYLKLITPLSQP